jgi:hypothetical protein
MILKIPFPGLIPYAVRARWQHRKSESRGHRWYFQPLTVGPAREIVIRMMTRRSRTIAAR